MNDHIRLPVPPAIAAAWDALPPDKRTSLANAIVEAWLEPMLLRPRVSPTLVPYYTIREETPVDPDDRDAARAAHAVSMARMARLSQEAQQLHAELHAMVARQDARARRERGEDGFEG
jgi:hypothetical protein